VEKEEREINRVYGYYVYWFKRKRLKVGTGKGNYVHSLSSLVFSSDFLLNCCRTVLFVEIPALHYVSWKFEFFTLNTE